MNRIFANLLLLLALNLSAHFIIQGQGTEKISNGTLDSSNDWTIINSGFTIGGGVASFDGVTPSHLRQTASDMISVLEDSKSYIITFDISTDNDTCFAYIRILGSINAPVYKASHEYYTGSHKVFITTPSSGNDGGIDFYATATGDAFTIDNISVVELPPLTGGPYFVATEADGGNDINDGSIENPWASWGRAINAAAPGDTVYFRGGVYYKQPREEWRLSATAGLGVDGERGNPISYMGYPPDIAIGDSIIFDCSLMFIPQPDTVGIEALPPTASPMTVSGIACESDFIVFKGFTIRNIYQKRRYVQTTGFNMSWATNLLIENVKLYNCSGHGFYYSPYWSVDGRDSTIFLNNDAYNCIDSFSVNVANYRDLPNSPQAGSWGNGFMLTVMDSPHADTSSYVQFIGNRAWHNADEGTNHTPIGTVYDSANWMFANGYHLVHGVYDNQTTGNGWKLNGGYWEAYTDTNIVQLYFNNNIAAFNHGYGYGENAKGMPSGNREVYNNTSYKNAYGYNILDPQGFEDTLNYKNIYRNNIAYDNRITDVLTETYMYLSEYNSWDTPPGVTVTDADFIVTDSATAISQLKAPRNADGSLPTLTFLTLASGSDLIDAGTDVGLPYEGTAPDLGYSEYNAASPTPPIADFLASSVTVTEGQTVTFTDLSTNTPTEWSWSFEGGTPSTSVAENPTITYNTAGTYDVTLTATNADGSDGETKTDYITVSSASISEYKLIIQFK